MEENMYTKKPVAQTRKVIKVILLLVGVCFSILGAGVAPSVRAQEAPTSTSTPSNSSSNHNQHATPLGASASSEPIPSQIIIKFASHASEKEKEAFVQARGGKVMKRIDALNIFVIH